MSNLSCLGFDVTDKQAFAQLVGRLSLYAIGRLLTQEETVPAEKIVRLTVE